MENQEVVIEKSWKNLLSSLREPRFRPLCRWLQACNVPKDLSHGPLIVLPLDLSYSSATCSTFSPLHTSLCVGVIIISTE